MKKERREREGKLPIKIQKILPKTAEYLMRVQRINQYEYSNHILAQELKTRGYSFELYADIAARLLVGNDFNQAAESALSLLNTCRNVLKLQAVAKIKERATAAVIKTYGLNSPTISFNELAKAATGKKLYVAKRRFEDFVVDVLKPPQQRHGFLSKLKNGVTREAAVHLIMMYSEWEMVMQPLKKLAEKKSLLKPFTREFAKIVQSVAKETETSIETDLENRMDS